MNSNHTDQKIYTSPELETLDVKVEGILCSSPSVTVGPWGNGGSLGDHDIK